MRYTTALTALLWQFAQQSSNLMLLPPLARITASYSLGLNAAASLILSHLFDSIAKLQWSTQHKTSTAAACRAVYGG